MYVHFDNFSNCKINMMILMVHKLKIAFVLEEFRSEEQMPQINRQWLLLLILEKLCKTNDIKSFVAQLASAFDC